MEPVDRGRLVVVGSGLLSLVLLLTWVSAGPYVNLFAPFDKGESGVGAPPISYRRYEGLPEVARGPGGGGVWQWVGAVLAGCVLVGLLVWLLGRVGLRLPSLPSLPSRNRGSRAAEDLPPAEGSIAGTDLALQEVMSELSTGDDPRSSIIAAWRDLEQASASAGRSLAISRTPDDVTTMLAALGGDRRASEDFERIYLAARYSKATLTEASRQQAVALLTHLRGQMSLVASGGDH